MRAWLTRRSEQGKQGALKRISKSFNKLNELAQRLEANEARQDTGPKVVQALDLKDQSLVNL